MYRATGSGLFYNVGKTIAFPDHPDANKYFGLSHPEKCHGHAKLTLAAARAGFDSIQFVAKNEGNLKFEIVDTHHALVKGPCPDDGHADKFTSCWNGSSACSCDASKIYLNCWGNNSTCKPPF
eukprot:gnl/TRDRNA2_/TRDRNA2_92965_c2_seq1.p1 gnl/TRDRNA2_/TRDRNA2_92965_c2~~gnl/TRDRNA2_/TRDRNA2_92965_c2_seq1.p1  ORF type:complete len:123 (-),score=9.43 gnl/TRDRNA2_/TRDRNA2_92965_c2_seq1:40-408(-)